VGDDVCQVSQYKNRNQNSLRSHKIVVVRFFFASNNSNAANKFRKYLLRIDKHLFIAGSRSPQTISPLYRRFVAVGKTTSAV